jgi:hypothetical protein
VNPKPKPKVDEEYRMSAAEFDKTMRGALSAPSPAPKEAERAAKKVRIKKAKVPPRK